jgi:hypothetical protein
VFDTGYVKVGSFRGAPIRFHWSIPFGAVLFTGFRFVPGAWLGIVVLILLHELGHAVLVKSRGLSIVSIDVHGLGGVCRYQGDASPKSRAIIAWGGVLAQFLAFVVAFTLVLVLGMPSQWFLAQFVDSFLWSNLMLAAFNLIPIKPLDGGDAWQLPRIWNKQRQHRRTQKKIERVRKAEAAADGDQVRETVRQALARAQRDSRGEKQN